MKKAVVLLSGGLDSATTAAIAISQGFEVHALSFSYGQRHLRELESSKAVAKSLGIHEHLVINFDMGQIGGSALTAPIDVPKGERPPEGGPIPVTYVPARNTVFLSFALGWAEVLEAPDIFIGANINDYSGYPDCRPEYLEAFEQMANLATKASVEGKKLHFRINAPLLRMTKAQIIKAGAALGVDYSLTWSCYDPQPDGRTCGRCDSCLFRAKGFEEAGITDPLLKKNKRGFIIQP
ncbi:MAG: 7-cyano-7-deazaguanine synthase QueC [Nitrospiraceae bacterium]|nr:7-cyano-7-deazaguanine synthase QueC [Nitrospiraceae bacterium]